MSRCDLRVEDRGWKSSSFYRQPSIFSKILFLLIIIIAFTTFTYFNTSKEVEKLSKSLQDVSLDVQLEEKNYRVENGQVTDEADINTKFKILRLAAFYQWTKEDPLFYSPDLDIEEFKKAVEFIKAENDKLTARMEIKEHFYPADFLEKFVLVAAITKEFLEHPGDQLAEKLIHEQEELVKAYEKEAQDLLHLIPEEGRSKVAIGIEVSNKIFRDDLKKIIENAKSLKEELTKRERCLKDGEGCIRPVFSYAKPKLPLERATRPPRILDKGLVFNLNTPGKRKKAEISGPYGAKSLCFGWNEDLSAQEHWFYTRKRPPGERKFLNLRTGISVPIEVESLEIELADDIFFINVIEQPGELGQSSLDKGIRYVYINSTNPYMCPQRSFMAEVAQQEWFFQNKKPVFGDFFREARDFEEKFFQDKYPTYDNLSLLADFYGYAYRLLSENPNAEWAREFAPLKDEFLSRYLSIKGRLGQAHLVLNFSSEYVKLTRYELEEGGGKGLPGVFATDRSFYGTYFLPFSPAIWRSPEELYYIRRRIVKNVVGWGAPYIKYSQLRQRYSEEEIKPWLSTKKEAPDPYAK